ncbi:MAG: hypothetical protein GWP04_12650 [Gammaproteobacteria bacterium]|nr:hypothetical protein [Gammaproteobacteria bacterium]
MFKTTLFVAFAAVTVACTAPAPLPAPTTTTTAAPPPSTTVVAPPAVAAPARPFPQHVDYSTPHITPSATSIDADTRRFYDFWKEHYLVGLGSEQVHPRGGERRSGATVSEGQGYAMVITALMGGHDPQAQQLFDALWSYARAHPSDIDEHLMKAMTVPDRGMSGSVFGGDASIAYSLLLADRQWGSDGAVDYETEARVLIRAIEKSTIGPTSHLPLLGDWVDPDGAVYNEQTVRISDIMPDHFAAFEAFTSDSLWDKTAEASKAEITGLEARWSRLTGLMPGFAVVDQNGSPRPAPAGYVMGSADGAFGDTAARYPLWVGAHALTSDDPFWRNRMLKISHWASAVTDGDPRALDSGYELDGSPLDQAADFSVLFGGPLAVAAMVNTDQQPWLDALYAAIRNRHEGYYEDSVALISLLVLGGNWWSP